MILEKKILVEIEFFEAYMAYCLVEWTWPGVTPNQVIQVSGPMSKNTEMINVTGKTHVLTKAFQGGQKTQNSRLTIHIKIQIC